MKKKELKNLAMRIAVLENKLSKTEDKEEQKKIQEAIIKESVKVTSLDDMFALDELIQQFLKK